LKLPNVANAVVSREKITGYLLSATHPTGRHKAKFFASLGFSVESWGILVEALVRHASTHEITKVESTPFGMRYIIDGSLETPCGRKPSVRVVWFVERGERFPRLVTAYAR